MNPPILNRTQSREVDRVAIEQYGFSGLVLMENAGRGVADKLCELGIAAPVVICCGRGNNGGDGLVIARHLDLRGHRVRVLLWAEPSRLAPDAAANFAILRKTDVPIEIFTACDRPRLDRHLAGASWIVDALLGTGSRSAARPPLDAAIERLNHSGVPIMAVDLPSGLDCDTGEASPPTIRATATCTFAAAKPGFFIPGAQQYTGQLHVLDIGTPRKLLAEVLRGPGG